MRIIYVYQKPTLILILIITFLFLYCKNQKKIPITKEVTKLDSTTTNVQQLMLSNQSEFEENINSLMKLIKEKEYELKKTELNLKQKSAELDEKERQLAKIEAELKQFRNITYLILIVGIVLIVIGLIKSSKKSGSSATI